MAENKTFTIRVPKDSTLYDEIVRRREATDGPWATVVQELLTEGWHTILLQRFAEDTLSSQQKEEFIKYQERTRISREYVRHLETLLASYMTQETHPRYQEKDRD